MIKAYVLKKGGMFVTENGPSRYTKKLSRAGLLPTRNHARALKFSGEKIYRISLRAVEFEKVS